MNYSQKFFISLTFFLILKVDKFQHKCKLRPKYMCVYCHMSKKFRVGRSGLNFFFLLLLSAQAEIVVPGSGIRYFIFEITGKMTNYAVFLPSLLSISTKS